MNAKEFINQAEELIKGKRLAKSYNELVPIKMDVIQGTNEYNTHVYLSRKDGGVFAYFCNGRFCTTIGGHPVELIL